MSTPKAYTIVGGGAIGGTLGWHLAEAGHSVTIVDADRDHVHAIAGAGLLLEREGVRRAQQVSVAHPDDVGEAALRRVLLAVKAQATAAASAWIAPRLASDGWVVSMQNGLNESVIAESIGRERVVGGFVDLFADVIEPGVIRYGGAGALAVGEVDGSTSARVSETVADLSSLGAQATTNIAGYLWSKLAFGAMLTGTALADAPMADLLDRHRAAAHTLAHELLTEAMAQGIEPLAFDAFEPGPYAADPGGTEAHRMTDRLVAWLRTQPKDRSGIWRDIAVRRRPTEVPTQYRPVLAGAARRGHDMPILTSLLAQLAEVEAEPASMAERRLEQLDADAEREMHG